MDEADSDAERVVHRRHERLDQPELLQAGVDPAPRLLPARVLYTGGLPHLGARTLLLETGRVVDHLVDALSEDGRVVGMMLPNAKQVGAYERSSNRAGPTSATQAKPYDEGRFPDAVDELKDADLIVMHCMGYSAGMKAEVARQSGKRVLLWRGLVAAAVQQLL